MVLNINYGAGRAQINLDLFLPASMKDMEHLRRAFLCHDLEQEEKIRQMAEYINERMIRSKERSRELAEKYMDLGTRIAEGRGDKKTPAARNRAKSDFERTQREIIRLRKNLEIIQEW